MGNYIYTTQDHTVIHRAAADVKRARKISAPTRKAYGLLANGHLVTPQDVMDAAVEMIGRASTRFGFASVRGANIELHQTVYDWARSQVSGEADAARRDEYHATLNEAEAKIKLAEEERDAARDALLRLSEDHDALATRYEEATQLMLEPRSYADTVADRTPVVITVGDRTITVA